MDETNTRVKRNLLSSLVYQVVLIALSFLLPRLYLENFGSEVNGVLSTIKQIFVYMLLLEAGVGLATKQALYERLSSNNRDNISSVLSATNIYYKRTGILYSAIVLVIAVVYAYIIPTSINRHELFLIIVLTALPSLFSYFVQAKYRILMEADGRQYVFNNAETALQLISNAAKILVLLLTDSLILIQLSYCLLALAQLVFLYVYAKRHYRWLNLKATPDFKAISQKDSVLVHQLSGMVFNNTDVILISALCDFTAASVYAIYNMFFAQVQNFIASVTSSVTFALGRLFHDDRNRFLVLFNAYETVYIMGTYIIYTLMAAFLLPLIQLYTNGINDAEYTNPLLLLLFVVMNLAASAKLPITGIIEYAGEFKNTRSHAVWEMVINLTVTVAGILLFGICGALVGTVAALLYRGIVTIRHASKVLERSQWQTYKLVLSNAAVFAAVMLILFVDAFSGASFGRLLLNGVIHSVWIVLLYAAVNFLVNKPAFVTMLELMGRKRAK